MNVWHVSMADKLPDPTAESACPMHQVPVKTSLTTHKQLYACAGIPGKTAMVEGRTVLLLNLPE